MSAGSPGRRTGERAAPGAARAREGKDALRVGLQDALEQARRSGREQLLCVRFETTSADPLACWGRAAARDRFYWAHPEARFALAAWGALRSFEADGPGRASKLAHETRDLFARLHRVGPSAPERAGPLLVGGFAFGPGSGADGADEAGAESSAPREWAGFPPARLWLPARLLVREGDRRWCSVCRIVAPDDLLEPSWLALDSDLDEARASMAEARPALGDADARALADRRELCARPGAERDSGSEYRVRADRPHAVYRQQVRAALEAIERGELEKVVVARSLEVRHPGRFDLEHFLGRLRETYPSCTSFALARGPECFVAASPERLVSLVGDEFETSALAGSAARGRTPEQDAALSRGLRESGKERREHAAVVQAIRAALVDVCASIDAPAEPELLKIEGIQHLQTPLVGRLHDAPASRPGVLELLERLHPTPAVCGLPRAAARSWLERHEGLDRGWYAGPVGFVDASGGGEFWVGLRSAWIHSPARGGSDAQVGESRARLYAGAGIVEGSDPERELSETRLKLRALLAPLTEI